VESDGTVYAVVAWDQNARTPILLRLGGRTRGLVRATDGQVFTFTTIDPTERPDINAVYSASEDLRARMANLADRLWTQIDADARWAAGQIRLELNK
jgi:hypothetical protein